MVTLAFVPVSLEHLHPKYIVVWAALIVRKEFGPEHRYEIGVVEGGLVVEYDDSIRGLDYVAADDDRRHETVVRWLAALSPRHGVDLPMLAVEEVVGDGSPMPGWAFTDDRPRGRRP